MKKFRELILSKILKKRKKMQIEHPNASFQQEEKSSFYDVFISYHAGIKDQVKIFYEKLQSTSANLKIWFDENEMRSNDTVPINDEIALALLNSKLVIFCLTADYKRSENLGLELEYANSLRKHIFLLQIEQLEKTPVEQSNIKSTISCFEHPKTWFEDMFVDIRAALQANLDLTMTNNIANETGLLNGRFRKLECLDKSSNLFKVDDLKDSSVRL
jgi:hypothetical protein